MRNLVIAVVVVGMVMNATSPVILNMRSNDQNNGRNQDPNLYGQKKLFDRKQDNSGGKQEPRLNAVMMFFISMIHRVTANCKGQGNHSDFKTYMMYDIDSKKR